MTKKRIAVIGAGVIGLPTAVQIIEGIPNVDVTIIADKFSPNTTGDGAAGWWEPYLSGTTPPVDLKRWGQETWDHLTSLLRSENAAKLGIQLVAGYNLFKTFRESPDWKDNVLGFRQVSSDEIRQIFPPDCGFNYGWAFTSLVTECPKYLPWLMKRFQANGGKIQQKHVRTIGELVGEFDVIVNCTGIGSYDLVNDKKMKPIKGQLVLVHAPWISVEVQGRLQGICPRSDYVCLGGTADEDRWDTDINPQDGKQIFERCCKLFPSLKNAKIVREWSGLRPGRTSIRVERENLQFGPHTIPVVHNYGHGGSGITLHWGCAKDATNLVRQCLQNKPIINSKL